MVSLLSVLRERFQEWPEGVDGFRCYPNGEVRGINTTSYDFFPYKEVYWLDRSSDFYGSNGIIITREIFEKGD